MFSTKIQKAGNRVNCLKAHFSSRICTWTESVATKSVASSASGEWQELKLFVGVFLGLGQDNSFEHRLSGDPGPKSRDIWR